MSVVYFGFDAGRKRFALRRAQLRPVLIAALCWPLGFSGQALGQAEAEIVSCNNAQSTEDMRECEIARLKRAEANMNAAYRHLSEKLDQHGQAKLHAEQQAWLKHRAAEAQHEADAARGGTLAPLIAVSVEADLTESRWKELEKAVLELK